MLLTAPQLRHAYRTALQAHLDAPGEETLHEAYELGRRAMALGVSVLDLAAAHHDVLAGALRRSEGPAAERLAVAAGAFLSESLSSYEMVRRGYREAAGQAALERGQAETVRRLSGFLADASLASDDPASSGEVLLLVAEAAAELVDAEASLVALRANGAPPWRTASSPPALLDGLGRERAGHLLAVHALLVAEGGPVRLGAAALRGHPAVGALARPPAAGGWLGVPLVALDGRLLGFVELAGWSESGPGEVDEAVIVHLAQMAAAALERAALYRRPRGV